MVSRNTRQKKIISEMVGGMKGFFTAEELLNSVRGEHSDIGLATVYRQLKAMKEENLLFSYRCDGRNVYSTKKRSHCHFVCKKTGKVIHFDVDSLDFLKDKIPGTIDSFQIEVTGTCEDCTDE